MRRSWTVVPRLRCAAALLTTLLALAAVPAVAAAADLYVATTGNDGNDCLSEATACRTIQHAVDVADGGDTIRVAAGEYAESVEASVGLSFIGPFPFLDPHAPDRGGAAEARWVGGSGPALTIAANDVAVRGFMFGPASDPASGEAIQVETGVRSAYIGFSIFENLTRAIDLHGAVGTLVDTDWFRDNTFGIVGHDDEDTTAMSNDFTDNGTAISLDGSSDGEFSSNESDGDGAFARTSATSAAFFLGNLIDGVTDAGFVSENDSGTTYLFNNVSGPGDGIRFEASPDGDTGQVTVFGNNLFDLGGSAIHAANGALDTSVDANGNRYFGTDETAVVAEGDSVIDARNSWWGCNGGPGTPGCEGAGGTGTVMTDPWTIMTVKADDAAITTGGTATLITTSFDTNSDGDPIVRGTGDLAVVAYSTTLGTVDPGQSCVCGGASRTYLTSGDEPGTATVTASLDSQSVTTQVEFLGPWARIAPDGFDFGSVAIGGFSPLQKLTVKNTGSEDLDITDVGIGGSDDTDFLLAQDGCSGQLLTPGEFCSVKVRFAPTGAPAGPRAAALAVDSNVPAGSTDAELTGTATTIADVRLTPASFSFGDVLVGQASPYQKWTVKNTGGSTITVESVDLQGEEAGQFQRAANGCDNVVLQPGEYCTLKVRFRPAGAPGPRSAQLVVASDVPGTHTAELTGTATGI